MELSRVSRGDLGTLLECRSGTVVKVVIVVMVVMVMIMVVVTIVTMKTWVYCSSAGGCRQRVVVVIVLMVRC